MKRYTSLITLILWLFPILVRAQSTEQVKPYILLVLDISGSMDSVTGTGAPSCGGPDTRLSHAMCAIRKLVNSHGDVEFGFGRFRKNQTSGTCSNNCDGGGTDCSSCDGDPVNNVCTAAMRSADTFELLVPINDESAVDIEPWVDLTCGACSYDPNEDPGMSSAGWTPIGGSLRGAKRYFQGNDPFYDTTLLPIYGDGPSDPIRNDPYKLSFTGGEQCRPYITVMLTDGAETCSAFDDGNRDNDNDTIDAVTALLTTTVDTKTYRVETKPIGFGISAGNSQIEGIAHAGGTPNVANQNEGFYASDEVSLSQAFNQIISDSIKVEVCDGVDNDCDGEVDEGFQLYCDKDGVLGPVVNTATLCTKPVDDCDGVDDNCFEGTDDEITNACGTCGPAPTEICDNIDNDCDGGTDEGDVCGDCVFQGAETCNDEDDNCNGMVDEGLTRQCGTDLGICDFGIEVCVTGEWGECSEDEDGVPEMCNGVDDNCDGIIDGFAEECAELPGNNAPFDGPCQPGIKICPTDGSGEFGDCLGEVGPSPESCDLIDNNCNGDTDEGTGGGDCSSTCGTGTYVCDNGQLVCEGGNVSSPEICNNEDDDCDTLVDENLPTMGPCDNDGMLCLPGELVCIGGEYECVGGVPPGPEICDCLDNNCNDQTDENPETLCPSGTQCIDCACAAPCSSTEFPCEPGFQCEEGFCVVDKCYDVTCTPDGQGRATTCVEGDCVLSCSVADCPSNLVCRDNDGQCVPDTCEYLPKCTTGQLCQAGTCVDDPCANVTCEGAEFCQGGECKNSCSDITCPDKQKCEDGMCVADLCAGVTCGDKEVCNPTDGSCTDDLCRFGTQCGAGLECNPVTGDCDVDLCWGVTCPSQQACYSGNCFNPDQLGPDGKPINHQYVTSGGGGGCTTGGGIPSLIQILMLLFGYALVSRRRQGI